MSIDQFENPPVGSAAGEMPVFNPEQVTLLSEQVTGYLRAHGCGEPFESQSSFNEDELLGVISLYALVANNKKEQAEKMLVTKEVLIPMLCIPDVKNMRQEYKRIAVRLNEVYKLQAYEETGIVPKRGIVTPSYSTFLGKIARTLKNDFQRNRFVQEDLPTAAKIPSIAPVPKVKTATEPQATSKPRPRPAAPELKTLPKNAPFHLKLTHGLIRSAELDVEQASGLSLLLTPTNHGSVNAYEISAANQIKKALLTLFDTPVPKTLELTNIERLYVDKFLGKDKPRTVASLLNESKAAGISNDNTLNHLYLGLAKLARQLELAKKQSSRPEK